MGGMKGIREGKAKGRRKRKKLDASSSLSSFPPPSFTRPLSLPSPTVNSSPQDSSWPTGEGRPIIITAALRDTFALVSAVRHTPRDGALMTLRRESVAP